MKLIIEKILNPQNLTQEEARNVMLKIMSGEFNDAQISGFLIALRAKGETSDEIAGFVQAMRDKMTRIDSVENAIDMCGTGGDASGTFNISTTATFVVAAAGVPVAKHGNRSMTSKYDSPRGYLYANLFLLRASNSSGATACISLYVYPSNTPT